jgi:parallel beta-helix repeat protein
VVVGESASGNELVANSATDNQWSGFMFHAATGSTTRDNTATGNTWTSNTFGKSSGILLPF